MSWSFPRLCFLLGVYNFSSYIFRSSVNLCIWYKVKVQFHSFPCVCLVLSTPFNEETVLYPLSDRGTLVEDHSTIYTRVYLWALYSVSSIYIVCLYASTMGFIRNETVTKRNMHLKLYCNVLFHWKRYLFSVLISILFYIMYFLVTSPMWLVLWFLIRKGWHFWHNRREWKALGLISAITLPWKLKYWKKLEKLQMPVSKKLLDFKSLKVI